MGKLVLRVAGTCRLTVSAKVHDRRSQSAQLSKQIEWFDGPAGDELELIPIATALELHVDRVRLLVEGKAVGSHGVGSQEQDLVLGHMAHRIQGRFPVRRRSIPNYDIAPSGSGVTRRVHPV
jgi:hypothetical protein